MKPRVYHEKQIRELCAMHCLNNLFQEKGSFTKYQLDEICRDLSPDEWINPHRSILGLGNYDINVIMTALQRKDCEAIWFDKRKDPSMLRTENIFGFILNVPTDYKLGFITFPCRRRHWISVRKVYGIYYNLDSKMDRPSEIGDEQSLIDYLQNQIQNPDKELFIIVEKRVEEQRSWFRQ